MKKYIGPIIGTLAITIISLIIWKQNKKIGYVNTYMVYDQFKLRKELEDKLKKTQLSRQALLDSIRAKMQFVITGGATSEEQKSFKIAELKEVYYVKEQQFERENEEQAQQYTSQIWEQLNQYVKEYGEQNQYTYILGANGQGSLMYANETEDVTKEVIEFVNRKYDGKLK